MRAMVNHATRTGSKCLRKSPQMHHIDRRNLAASAPRTIGARQRPGALLKATLERGPAAQFVHGLDGVDATCSGRKSRAAVTLGAKCSNGRCRTASYRLVRSAPSVLYAADVSEASRCPAFRFRLGQHLRRWYPAHCRCRSEPAGVAASPTHTRAPRRLTATHRPNFVINGVLAQRIRSCALAPSDSSPDGLPSSCGFFHVALQAFRSYTGNSDKTHSPSPYNTATVASISGNCLACRTGPMLPVEAHRIIGWFDQIIWGWRLAGGGVRHQRQLDVQQRAGEVQAVRHLEDACPWRASADFADAELCQKTCSGRAEADAGDPSTGD